MGEPWLDSLSEDWNSEPRLSSPAPSLRNSKHGTHDFRSSQSRIPHLAHSISRAASSGSYLRPRSTRGIAKANGIPVLSERSASSLNLQRSVACENYSKRLSSTSLPRKPSSNFSDSQQSVQRYDVDTTALSTPEWKKRIQNGEDIHSDGFDLFSPSKLEGMFAQPTHSTPELRKTSSPTTNDSKPWSSLYAGSIQQPLQQFQSLRTSRSRAPPLECLLELSEEEKTDPLNHDLSAISSEIVRNGSIRGLVRRRVSDLEHGLPQSSPQRLDNHGPSNFKDPRWRTTSGQEEIRNEDLTPLTASAKNTISSKAMRESIELDAQELKTTLLGGKLTGFRRPSSRSSDRDVSYNGHGSNGDSLLHEYLASDVTSHSLPEDLSMGTQDFVSHGGYVNMRRGPPSTEASFLKKNLSFAEGVSWVEGRNTDINKFRSSPPPYESSRKTSNSRDDRLVDSLLEPEDNSVVHHDPITQRPTGVNSPLKLFGDRDTYTNNKLLRVLSQYEEDGSDQSESNVVKPAALVLEDEADTGLRMSKFGQGELDTFNFEQEITRPAQTVVATYVAADKIFDSVDQFLVDGRKSKPSKAMGRRVNIDQEDSQTKRQTSSPGKERTPKRRRTLVRDEITVENIAVEIKIQQKQEDEPVVGRKRKDSRPGEDGIAADPATLASRSILRPKTTSRKSSSQSLPGSNSEASTVRRVEPASELTEALAAELITFAEGVTKAHDDSRKPSLATKDYMEEANKVMEFIRARGKPKHSLPDLKETLDSSALDADKILDIEVEEDSTLEPFSRPPSREGPVKPREDRRIAKHDPQMANHLQKFKDSDDMDHGTGTSTIAILPIIPQSVWTAAAQFESPIEMYESDPPNVRVLSHRPGHSKNRQSAEDEHDAVVNTAHSSDSNTRRSFATESSNNSGQKGIITSGKVSIPDNVGTMTFDREKQVWIKQNIEKIREAHHQQPSIVPTYRDEVSIEDDPFEDIPDLSIDEQHEAAMTVVPKPMSRSSTVTVQYREPTPSPLDVKVAEADPETHQIRLGSCQKKNADEHAEPDKTTDDTPVLHEEQPITRLDPKVKEATGEEVPHDQIINSKASIFSKARDMQPRVVTIAFSSPVASEIPQPAVDISEPASDDEDFLPPADSDDDTEYLKSPKPQSSQATTDHLRKRQTLSSARKHHQYRSTTLHRRPVSRIEERDEDGADDGLSLVHVAEPHLITPAAANGKTSVRPVSSYKGTSILCLTPLSDFTMHQADKVNHPEESFVQERAHRKALLQAHGALALSVDNLIKAITDSVPDEPFWEQVRKLDLHDHRLQTMHGLSDYCPGLEILNISGNKVAQLEGIPATVRALDSSNNIINDFTSWGHLQNLQIVNTSNNLLENLEGFSSLIHLRKLTACNNKISDIEGVVDLDGLISLDLGANQLMKLDFEGVEMPELRDLDLSNNQLTSVKNLQCLPQLKKLDLSGNNLQEFVPSEPLKSLKTLILSGNQLEMFDLSMFPALIELNLDGNCIQNIRGLPSAGRLRELSLRDQRGSIDIVNQVLAVSNECSRIALSSNVVPHGELRLPRYPHYNLQHLEVAACGLHHLPVGFGDYFPNCRTLNLNFNAISELSPLVGSIKVRDILLAGNRIKRLRRSCLALSRMPALHVVDLRNNPLTVGFYAQEDDSPNVHRSFLLSKGSEKQDNRWLQLLDETTGMKRRMIEMMLAEGCPHLEELDGLKFDRQRIQEADSFLHGLRSTGVLMKTIEAAPANVVEEECSLQSGKRGRELQKCSTNDVAYIASADISEEHMMAEEEDVVVG